MYSSAASCKDEKGSIIKINFKMTISMHNVTADFHNKSYKFLSQTFSKDELGV